MLVELNDRELEMLRTLLDTKRKRLLKQTASADVRDFKQGLKDRLDVLDGIYEKLGCQRPEYSTEATCEVPPSKAGV